MTLDQLKAQAQSALDEWHKATKAYSEFTRSTVGSAAPDYFRQSKLRFAAKEEAGNNAWHHARIYNIAVEEGIGAAMLWKLTHGGKQ